MVAVVAADVAVLSRQPRPWCSLNAVTHDSEHENAAEAGSDGAAHDDQRDGRQKVWRGVVGHVGGGECDGVKAHPRRRPVDLHQQKVARVQAAERRR